MGLAATVGMHDQPRLGLAQDDGHLQGRAHQFFPEIDARPDFIVPAPNGLRKAISVVDSI